MPTIMTHAVVAVASGAMLSAGAPRKRLLAMALIAAVLPDADVIGYLFLSIPYGHPLGHRGFFHSPFFAALFSLLAVGLFFRGRRMGACRWWACFLFIFVVGASHGLLDAMTNGGRGIALLSPFSNQRFFLPWTPIEVSPIGIRAFFSPRGLVVMQSEILCIWLPAMAILILGWLRGRIMSGRQARKV